MKVLAIYFSHTGTTEQMMRAAVSLLEASGCEIRLERIHPEVDLPPPLWLVQSFFPGAKAPILPIPVDPAGYDACLLGLPKWTFACPPINGFLTEQGDRLPPTALAITCGGWDQERYLEELETRMNRMGVQVAAGITLRRKEIESQEAEDQLATLVGELVSAAVNRGSTGGIDRAGRVRR